MKKLNLKLQELTGPEVLTRQQLKNVLGGVLPATTVHNCAVYLPPGTGVKNTTWVQWGMSQPGIGYSSAVMDNGTLTLYGVSSADAQAQAVGAGAHWCCDSCSSASWYNAPA